MKHTHEEITNALKVIRDTCKEHDKCEDCPLGSASSDCNVNGNNPEDWHLRDEEIWRAFE